ncbi:MAG: hypothetical protein AAGK00_02830 [Pseudomonadota bacterium]
MAQPTGETTGTLPGHKIPSPVKFRDAVATDMVVAPGIINDSLKGTSKGSSSNALSVSILLPNFLSKILNYFFKKNSLMKKRKKRDAIKALQKNAKNPNIVSLGKIIRRIKKRNIKTATPE